MQKLDQLRNEQDKKDPIDENFKPPFSEKEYKRLFVHMWNN